MGSWSNHLQYSSTSPFIFFAERYSNDLCSLSNARYFFPPDFDARNDAEFDFASPADDTDLSEFFLARDNIDITFSSGLMTAESAFSSDLLLTAGSPGEGFLSPISRTCSLEGGPVAPSGSSSMADFGSGGSGSILPSGRGSSVLSGTASSSQNHVPNNNTSYNPHYDSYQSPGVDAYGLELEDHPEEDRRNHDEAVGAGSGVTRERELSPRTTAATRVLPDAIVSGFSPEFFPPDFLPPVEDGSGVAGGGEQEKTSAPTGGPANHLLPPRAPGTRGTSPAEDERCFLGGGSGGGPPRPPKLHRMNPQPRPSAKNPSRTSYSSPPETARFGRPSVDGRGVVRPDTLFDTAHDEAGALLVGTTMWSG